MTVVTVLGGRPDLTAGSGISRATLRQRKSRERAVRLACKCSRSKLFVGKTDEWLVSLSAASRFRAPSRESSAPYETVYGAVSSDIEK